MARPRPAPPPPGVDRWAALVAYDGPARELLAQLKYRNCRASVAWLAAGMAALVAGWVQAFGPHLGAGVAGAGLADAGCAGAAGAGAGAGAGWGVAGAGLAGAGCAGAAGAGAGWGAGCAGAAGAGGGAAGAGAVGGTTVTWAPTSAARLRTRGFDQARLLAVAVARRLELPCLPLLIRLHGPPQTGRSGAERRHTAGFVLDPRWAGRAPPRVLVVDDVATTGATLSAAARALRAGGVDEVDAVVAARRPLYPFFGSVTSPSPLKVAKT